MQVDDVAHFDVGGVSEGQRITHLAAGFDRCIAPPDCTGPISLPANVHMLIASPNALFCQSLRDHTRGFYHQIVNGLPAIDSGFIRPLERLGIGIGTELCPTLLTRSDARLRLTGEGAPG